MKSGTGIGGGAEWANGQQKEDYCGVFFPANTNQHMYARIKQKTGDWFLDWGLGTGENGREVPRREAGSELKKKPVGDHWGPFSRETRRRSEENLQ